jgi:hypothetical protein
MTETKEKKEEVISTGKTRAEALGLGKLKSSAVEFWTGEAVKAESGIEKVGNRRHRRERIRKPLSETLRQAKRVDRMMMLKEMAAQIKDWYPDDHMYIADAIKEWYPETYKEVTLNNLEFFPIRFKDLDKWKEIEAEMIKLLSRQGESNITPKQKKR